MLFPSAGVQSNSYYNLQSIITHLGKRYRCISSLSPLNLLSFPLPTASTDLPFHFFSNREISLCLTD